jgi:hypothetical protein
MGEWVDTLSGGGGGGGGLMGGSGVGLHGNDTVVNIGILFIENSISSKLFTNLASCWLSRMAALSWCRHLTCQQVADIDTTYMTSLGLISNGK